MRIRAEIAGMKMERKLGHVATAIAPSDWKKNWPEAANRFWKILICWRAIRSSSCSRNRTAALHRGIAIIPGEKKNAYDTYLHIMMRQFVG